MAADRLTRHLGLVSATALVVGEVVAVGIFLTPAGMARSLGSPVLLLAVWLVMGAMALSGALCYGELAARFPFAGGSYVYLREAFGPRLAFLYGWKCLLVMDPGITAALAVGLGSYVGYVAGLSPIGMKVVAISSILALALVNVAGLRVGGIAMRMLTGLKLGLLAFLALWGFGLGLGDWSNFSPLVAQRPGSDAIVAALASGLVAAFFSFGGWWDLSKLAGEVRDPARVLPRALALGVAIVTAVYILTTAVFVYLVPIESVTSDETFAAQAGSALFGPAGGEVFAGIVIVSVLGSLVGLLMAGPRVAYAMARDGVLFGAIARIHPRFGTPARAIAIQAALACGLVVVGTFDEILAYFIFVTVLFIGLTVVSVYVLRAKTSERSDFQTPGYPVTPALFLGLLVLLLALLGAHSPLQALLGVSVVALGVPIYHILVRTGRLTPKIEGGPDDLDPHNLHGRG